MTAVAVVIPSRNRSVLVRRAVASALAQEGVAVEVIVVLDAGEDDSAARLAELDDRRLRVLSHDQRRGDGQARNTGLAASTAPWVAFLDDDDVWAPAKLRLALEAADKRDFAYAGAMIVDARWEAIEALHAPDPATLLPTMLRYNAMPAGASNVVARRDALVELGGFDTGLTHLSDWDLWIRLAATATAGAVPELTVACTYHAGNRSLYDLRKVERDFRVIRERHRKLARAHRVEIDRVSFDRWTASARRRGGRRGLAAALYLRSAVRNVDPASAPRALNALVMPSRVTRQRPAPPLPAWLSELIARERAGDLRP